MEASPSAPLPRWGFSEGLRDGGSYPACRIAVLSLQVFCASLGLLLTVISIREKFQAFQRGQGNVEEEEGSP